MESVLHGLLLRTRELETFLKHTNVDIALISETHFICKNYLRISEYKTYFTTHPSGRVHTGSAIKNNIKYFPYKEIRLYSDNDNNGYICNHSIYIGIYIVNIGE